MTQPQRCLYSVLGVEIHADLDDIRRAYRRAAKQTHPDVGGNHSQFIAVRHAYDVLKDPTTRQEYDSALSVQTNMHSTHLSPNMIRCIIEVDAAIAIIAAYDEWASTWDDPSLGFFVRLVEGLYSDYKKSILAEESRESITQAVNWANSGYGPGLALWDMLAIDCKWDKLTNFSLVEFVSLVDQDRQVAFVRDLKVPIDPRQAYVLGPRAKECLWDQSAHLYTLEDLAVIAGFNDISVDRRISIYRHIQHSCEYLIKHQADGVDIGVRPVVFMRDIEQCVSLSLDASRHLNALDPGQLWDSQGLELTAVFSYPRNRESLRGSLRDGYLRSSLLDLSYGLGFILGFSAQIGAFARLASGRGNHFVLGLSGIALIVILRRMVDSEPRLPAAPFEGWERTGWWPVRPAGARWLQALQPLLLSLSLLILWLLT